jgi:hypothetical protein
MTVFVGCIVVGWGWMGCGIMSGIVCLRWYCERVDMVGNEGEDLVVGICGVVWIDLLFFVFKESDIGNE